MSDDECETSQERIEFKASYWGYKDVIDRQENKNYMAIYCTGITETNKQVVTQIVGYQPHVYLELPKRIKWNKTKVLHVMKYIEDELKSDMPTSYKYMKREKIKYRQMMDCLRLTFKTTMAYQRCSKIFMNANDKLKSRKKPIVIAGLGTFRLDEFMMHEHNIDPIIKFTALKKLNTSGWLSVCPISPEQDVDDITSEGTFSTCAVEMVVHSDDVKPVDKSDTIITKEKYLCFDIETYSKNHQAREPDPSVEANEVIQISCIVGRYHEPLDKRKVYLITTENTDDIPGAVMLRCKTEKELILTFTKIVQKENPDTFEGYNISRFDFNYLIARASHVKNDCRAQFLMMTKLARVEANVRNINWSSSAYGEQKYSYADCTGRVIVDVLIDIEKNHKLPKYTLDAVSEHFLKKKKEDLTHRQLFKLRQIDLLLSKYWKLKRDLTKTDLKAIQEIVLEQVPIEDDEKETPVTKFRDEIVQATLKNIRQVMKRPMTIIGVYCIKDSILVRELENKLNIKTAMDALSNIMNIPASMIYTRGQGIRVLAQLYREALAENFVINFYPKEDEPENEEEAKKKKKFTGATVIEPVIGDHDNVACFDFASLYPSILQSLNICLTTIQPEGNGVSDDECYIVEWEKHKGCEHDTSGAKVKKAEVACEKHRYRYKRLEIEEYHDKDGTVKQRIKHQGLLPRLVTKLLAERKAVKKQYEKLEAKLKMDAGLADKDDIEEFTKKLGLEVIKKGTYTPTQRLEMQVLSSVLNARQLALKISNNSIFGVLGAATGYLQFKEGAASITAQGRYFIGETIDFIKRTVKGSKLIYGDTDSCMMILSKNLQTSFKLAREIPKKVSHFLKCKLLKIKEDVQPQGQLKTLYDAIPMSLEFEKMYGRYLLLSKKRYVAHIVNERGEIVDMTKKGVVLARRDNCEFLRDTYKKVINAVLEKKPESEVMYILYEEVEKLFTRQIPERKLLITKGIKSLLSYAKKKKGSKGSVWFMDANGDFFDDPEGPLDSRLVYQNLPHVQLALRMAKRGDVVPANTRLEYLYICVDESQEVSGEGDRLEDYSYYAENKKKKHLSPDFPHYIEKQLMKPITQLLNLSYKHEGRVIKTSDEILKAELEALPEYEKQTLKLARKSVEKKVETILERHDFSANFWRNRKSLLLAIKRYQTKHIFDKYLKQFAINGKQLKAKPERTGKRDKVHVRDGNPMKVMYEARKNYRMVVEEIKELSKVARVGK